MNQNQPILHVQQPWADAVPNFIERIRQAGMQVIRTFDLSETRAGALTGSCEIHGTEQCDCQMAVLLVYGNESQPISLVAHGHHGQTWFSMVEFMGATNVRLEGKLRSIFAPAKRSPRIGGDV